MKVVTKRAIYKRPDGGNRLVYQPVVATLLRLDGVRKFGKREFNR